MQKWDHIDLVGGILLLGIGLLTAIYASSHYSLGTPSNMGPGMFPTILGSILAVLGVMVIVPAFMRAEALPPLEYRSLIFVIASLLVFALILQHFGLVPAVAALTLTAALASPYFSLIQSIIIAIALSVIAVLTFTVGLGVPISIARWPF